MDDYARAEAVAVARKQQMMQIAAENRKLAEMKRQNNQASRVDQDVRENTNVANYHYKLQSQTIRWLEVIQ